MSCQRFSLLVGILLMFVGIILHIVGMATPQWMVCEYEGETCNFDLWDNVKCYDKNIKSVDPYEGEYPELTTVRGFVSIGLISSITALVAAVFSGSMEKDTLEKIGTGAVSLASATVVIGGSVYGGGIHDGDYGDPNDTSLLKAKIEENFHLGYSFILCMVAGFVFFTGGSIFYFVKSRKSGNSETETNENRSTQMSRY